MARSPASEFRVEEVRFMKIVVQHVTDDGARNDLRLQVSQLEEELFEFQKFSIEPLKSSQLL